MSLKFPRGVKDCPVPFPAEIDPFVSNGLQEALGKEWLKILDHAVDSARKQKIQELFDWGINNGTDFALFASGMLKWVPTENAGGKVVYDVLCLFYFVFDQGSPEDPGINQFQTKIDITSLVPPNETVDLTLLSQWIVSFAQQVGKFMSSPSSITLDSYETFVKSPLFHFEEAKVPAGGFKTFNDCFARELIKGMRPISCPENDNVIVYPADSTFDGAWPIHSDGTVHIDTYEMQTASIKGIDWPINALLQNSEYAEYFKGGIWMHAFLNVFDYHRQHAPVSGTVLEAKNIMGLASLNVVPEEVDGEIHLRPHRNFKHLKRGGKDNKDADLNAPDDPGYEFLQLRASIVIKNDVVGHVAVLPIGMAQVSSVVLNPAIVPVPGEALPTVKKGDEISHFEFGGSDIVLVFEQSAKVLILGATEKLPNGDLKGQKYLMGEALGICGLGGT